MENQTQELLTNADKVKDYFLEQLPAIVRFGLKVVLAILVFLIGRKVIAWLMKILRRSMEHANVDKGVIQFGSSMAKFALYVILVFNIATHFGVTESSVAALLGTAGVTIGLALQGGLANVAGGMMLLLFKPFQVGDYILLAQQTACEGTVLKIELCYTTLRSVDNKYVVIPNGTLSNSTITNVTAQEHRQLEIKVGISYEADIRETKKILEKLLKEDPDTKNDKDMVVFVDELAESAVIVGLRVWVPTDCFWPTKWRLNQRIKEEFDAQGIQIPYNQLDVHLH